MITETRSYLSKINDIYYLCTYYKNEDTQDWINEGRIKLNGKKMNCEDFIKYAEKCDKSFNDYSKKLGYTCIYKDYIQTPEEIKEEKKKYNLDYYDGFKKLYDDVKLFFDSTNASGIYKEIDGWYEIYGDGLKHFKTKQKKGIKKRPKAPLETNNNCLIGGRILTLNELDQIINNIKKQKFNLLI